MVSVSEGGDMYNYSAVYVGGSHGSPNDWAVVCDFSGHASLNLPAFKKTLFLVPKQEAHEIAAVLTRTRAVCFED